MMAEQIMDWRAENFRAKVVAQMEKALEWSVLTCKEYENNIYQKAKTREDYLALAARLILEQKEKNALDWRGERFRVKVVAQIEEAMGSSASPMTKSSIEMENHVFQKAKTRDEYQGLVARLIQRVTEMNEMEWRGERFRAKVVAQIRLLRKECLALGREIDEVTIQRTGAKVCNSSSEKEITPGAGATDLQLMKPVH